MKNRVRRRKKRIFWGIIFIFLFVLGGFGYLLLRAEHPPLEKMEEARTVLSEAQKKDAEIYCHRLYLEARSCYDSAMVAWKKENEKLIFLRHYAAISSTAQRSIDKGRRAISQSEIVQRDSRKEIQQEIAMLRKEMCEFEKLFQTLPVGSKVMNQHSRGKLLLNEAEIAFEKGDYNQGRQKSRQAAEMIRQSYQSGRQLVGDYFKSLPHWQKQLKEVVDRSKREKTYAIVVEKIPPRCILYDKGVQKYIFPAEFGKNWLGDKQREGDYATPEGLYRVTKKLSNSQTRYYKALLLDYPNAADRANFEKLKRKGVIPKHVRAGNLIEIHGTGGRGANWTNGCVALKDDDMSVLYRYAHNGIPVLIIGASRELNADMK